MMPVEQHDIDALFCRVLRLPMAERATFLEIECEADVRAQVEELLAFHDKAHREQFLGEPVLGFDAANPTASMEGENTRPADSPEHWPEIPGFEVLDDAFPGGMGVVFKVRQASVPGRPLALKVMRGGWDPASIGRFRRESDILACCQHPNIVQIHDAGEHRGHPFFTMEFVGGQSLAERLKQGAKYTPREAAELVRTLAAAVQYAHDQGILHRDLKPGNILIDQPDEDAKPIPKISDFGLAKRVDDDGGTATQAVMGSPRYMAWEQAAGKNDAVGPATDVYGLGAILYELLTETAPIDGSSKAEILGKAADSHHVVKASRSVNRRIDKDLDTICGKCLKKKPIERYGSARELKDDLDRYLADRPILARPVGTVESSVRWCRRYPLAPALIAVLLFGVIGMTVLFVRSQGFLSESLRATKAADKANLALLDALDSYVAWLLQEDVLAAPELEGVRAQGLRQAAEAYQRWLEQNRSNDAEQLRAARALFRLGQIEQMIGTNPRAIERYGESIAVLRRAAPSTRERDDRIELANAYRGLATALDAIGEEVDARLAANYAVALCNALLKDNPLDAEVRAAAATAYQALGDVHQYQDWPSALTAYEHAADYRRILCDETPTAENRYLLADSLRAMALAIYKVGGSEKPENRPVLEDLYAEALQLIDTLLVEAPGEFQYVHLRGRILSNRGLHETVWDDHDVAIETFREAVRVREKLAEDQPAVRKHQEGLATSLGNLAEAYRRGGRLQESIGPRERGIDICKKLLAKHKSEPSLRTDLATEVVRLAYTFHLMKDDQRAVESLRHASEVGVRLEHGEPDSLRQCYFAAVCYALVAATSTDAERGVATEKAIALLRRAWELAYFDRPDNVKLFADEEAFQALEGSREFQALKQEILSKRPANDGQVNTGKPVASQ